MKCIYDKETDGVYISASSLAAYVYRGGDINTRMVSGNKNGTTIVSHRIHEKAPNISDAFSFTTLEGGTKITLYTYPEIVRTDENGYKIEEVHSVPYRLDDIENGTAELNAVLTQFWKDFEKELVEAEKNIGSDGIEVPVEETDIICEKCGSKMVVKSGRFGKFAACPNYPTCKNTKPLENTEAKKEEAIADFKCEKCGSDMVLKKGPYGSFYACVNYPECKFTKQKAEPVEAPCPICGAQVLTRHGKNGKTVFYSCENYPKCNFSSWDMPVSEKCPDCGQILFRKKGRVPMIVCHNEACGYKRKEEATEDTTEEN